MSHYLSPKAEVGASPSGGFGLFAKDKITAKEVILDLGIGDQKLVDKLEADRLFESGFDYMLQVDEDKFAITVTEPESIEEGYINHSCEPNCGIAGSLQIVAMRDIKPGEELAFDYAMSESSDYKLLCQCGVRSCRKVVTGNDWKIPELQQKYGEYFSDYLRRKIFT